MICYQAGMGDDLDDILAQAQCPRCGREFSVRYRTLRLERTVDCPGCGVTVRPIDDTPIGAVQKLIDKAGSAA